MWWRCVHDWEKVVDFTTPSPVEQLSANGVNFPEGRVMDEPWWYGKVHRLVLVCKKCGEINKSVEFLVP